MPEQTIKARRATCGCTAFPARNGSWVIAHTLDCRGAQNARVLNWDEFVDDWCDRLYLMGAETLGSYERFRFMFKHEASQPDSITGRMLRDDFAALEA